MILYREEPVAVQMKNVILLDDKKGGVVYVNKTTYEQAVILHNRLDGNKSRIIELLKCKKTEAYITISQLKGLIDKMWERMPEPLNALAPFLMYCTANQNIKWDENDFELGYGILHEFSQLVDFNAMTLVPAEVRVNISVPTVILMQYKESWDTLLKTLEDDVMLRPVVQIPTQTVPMEVKPATPTAPVPVSIPTPVTSGYVEPVEEEPDEDIDNSISDEAYAKLQALFAANTEESEPESVTTSTSDETPKDGDSLLEDEVEKEKKEVKKILDEYDV